MDSSDDGLQVVQTLETMERSFYMDFNQFLVSQMRPCAFECHFPSNHPRFNNTKLPSNNSFIACSGSIVRTGAATPNDECSKRIVLSITDIAFLAADSSLPSMTASVKGWQFSFVSIMCLTISYY